MTTNEIAQKRNRKTIHDSGVIPLPHASFSLLHTAKLFWDRDEAQFGECYPSMKS